MIRDGEPKGSVVVSEVESRMIVAVKAARQNMDRTCLRMSRLIAASIGMGVGGIGYSFIEQRPSVLSAVGVLALAAVQYIVNGERDDTFPI